MNTIIVLIAYLMGCGLRKTDILVFTYVDFVYIGSYFLIRWLVKRDKEMAKKQYWDCDCWSHYPNKMREMKGRCPCTDRYICIRDRVETDGGGYDKKTHCVKRERIMENKEIKEYIEKFCNTHHITEEEALQHVIVQEYIRNKLSAEVNGESEVKDE